MQAESGFLVVFNGAAGVSVCVHVRVCVEGQNHYHPSP